jgi:hypothetical protein
MSLGKKYDTSKKPFKTKNMQEKQSMFYVNNQARETNAQVASLQISETSNHFLFPSCDGLR